MASVRVSGYAVVEEEAIELLTGQGSDTTQLHVGRERSHAGCSSSGMSRRPEGWLMAIFTTESASGRGRRMMRMPFGEIGLLHAEVGV